LAIRKPILHYVRKTRDAVNHYMVGADALPLGPCEEQSGIRNGPKHFTPLCIAHVRNRKVSACPPIGILVWRPRDLFNLGSHLQSLQLISDKAERFAQMPGRQ